MLNNQELIKRVNEVVKKFNADIFIYCGTINNEGVEQLIPLTKNKSRPNGFLFLSTYGGDAHAAYKIAKVMQKKYARFTVYLAGNCKSAGTLIAVGSDSIIMNDLAELGPLDAQILEKGALFQTSSLDILESLEMIKSQSVYFFLSSFNDISKTSSTSVPYLANLKKPAESILKSVTQQTCTFINSALSQIDFARLGQIQRDLNVVIMYGKMLIQNSRGNIKNILSLNKLANSYPSHSFVIDSDEALEVFNEILPADIEELALEDLLLPWLRPSPKDLFEKLVVQKLNMEQKNVESKSPKVP